MTGPPVRQDYDAVCGADGEIHNGRDKIITIEDPVEYQLPSILQIPVNEKKRIDFR